LCTRALSLKICGRVAGGHGRATLCTLQGVPERETDGHPPAQPCYTAQQQLTTALHRGMPALCPHLHRGRAHHPRALCNLRVTLDVDLHVVHPAREVVNHLAHDGLQGAAGAARGGCARWGRGRGEGGGGGEEGSAAVSTAAKS
jgi:hypothetical protein